MIETILGTYAFISIIIACFLALFSLSGDLPDEIETF
jgi:hypothetical protein